MPVTNYVWDPVDDNVVLETDNTNATTATYTNEPGRYGGLISQRRGSTDSYYHYDGLGSTRELTDDSETVTDTNLYDAWGVNVDSSGTTENPYRWVGRSGYYYDTETEDYYVRARVYQPATGRWWSVDPLYFLLVNPWYAYASNNSINLVDPSGLWEILREGKPKAEAIPEVGDTWAGLAKYIGLDFKDINLWLTTVPGNAVLDISAPPPEPRGGCDPLQYFVPNTMMALWAGELGALGRTLVRWKSDIDYLKKLGFKVDSYIANQHSDKVQKLPPGKFVEAVQSNSKEQQLHGIFIWGHGSDPSFPQPPVIANAIDDRATFVLPWKDISDAMKYKMALVLANTCFSDDKKSGRLLISPNAIFHGSPCTLWPVGKWADIVAQQFNATTFRHFVHIIKPGQQGTKKTKDLLEQFKDLLNIGKNDKDGC